MAKKKRTEKSGVVERIEERKRADPEKWEEEERCFEEGAVISFACGYPLVNPERVWGMKERTTDFLTALLQALGNRHNCYCEQ